MKVHQIALPVVFTLGVTWAPACSTDDEPSDGELGASCSLGKDECEDALECTEGEDGDGRCTYAAGELCDPDDDVSNGGCALTAVCQGTSGDAGDDAARCRILEGEECVEGEAYCADALTCAELESGGHRCFAPVVLRGDVSDTTTNEGIEAAHVIAIDEEGSAATSVAITDASGEYQLEVPALREDDGSPIATTFTLRASAQDYQAFPFGVRVALPIEVDQAESEDDVYVVDNALTAVGLIPLPAAMRHFISGRIAPHDDRESNLTGVLLVAKGEAGAFSATSDDQGQFTIFNVVDGDYEVRAYAADLQVMPEPVSVDAAPVTDVVLDEDDRDTVSVSGNIQIVNAPGGSLTSVILVVEDTFDAEAATGEVPRGLRAPRTGTPDIDGNFTIEGVPDGNYVVLAAYENDDLVRDPDENISGTDFVYISVSADDGDQTTDGSFKVTEALAVFSPGAEQPEAVSGAPELRWADDSSEDYYEVRVFDALGNEVWGIPDVPGVSGSSEVTVQYDGPLDAGMYYQFRVRSWRQSGNQDPSPISATEDLRGVFYRPAE